MAEIVVTGRADAELRRLQASRSLPPTTQARIADLIEALREYPKLGRSLGGPFARHRLLPGPWPWLVIIYRFDEAADRVVIVAFQDVRTSSAWTNG